MQRKGARLDERDLALVARLLPDPAVAVDAEGRLRWANAAADRLMGVRSEERAGESAFAFVHPDDLAAVAASLQSVKGKLVGTPIEVRVRAADGWRLVEVVGANLLDEPGVEALVLTLRDLTQRRRWEVAHQEVSRFRALVHNAATVLLLLDAAGRVESVSAAVTRILGHDQERVEGRLLAEFVVPDHRDRLTEALARPPEGPDGSRATVTVEVQLVPSDEGRPPVPFELHVVNLLDDPTVRGLVVSGHDISELRRSLEQLAEAQHQLDRRERLAAVGQLASMIGHELRNPLGAISATHQLVRLHLGTEIDPDLDRQLALAERESRRAVQLTEDLMSYVRPRKSQPVPLSPADVVGEVVEATPAPAGVTLQVDVDQQLSMTSDRGQLAEMVTNLLTNAYQALGSDGGAVVVCGRLEDDDVVITVADDGPGIEPGTEERLFEPFFSTKSRGTGLGLAIVQRLVDEQGGSVALEPRPGGGTTARLRLPRAPAAPAL